LTPEKLYSGISFAILYVYEIFYILDAYLLKNFNYTPLLKKEILQIISHMI